ncbi:MAG: methyl-accepting chemotaxis protein [Mariprofundaceae bacterium]|nr:methyl-accepting chemotaxis protein [Mariprofundaceae bacterium]
MLKRFSIRQKLFIPSLLVLFYFIVLLFLQIQGTTEHNRLNALNENISALDDQVDEIIEYTLQAAAISSMFQLTRKESDINAYKVLSEEVQHFFETMDASLLKAEDQDKFKKAQLQWLSSRDQFLNVVQVYKRMGLDENKGLLGDLRHTVHAVERTLDHENKITLLHSMLMMRRHEKDFLARNNNRYVVKMNKESLRFNKLLQASNLDKKSILDIAKKMDFYHSAFAKIVETKQQLTQAQKENNEKTNASLVSIERVLKSIRQELKENNDQQTATGKQQDRLFTWVLSVMSLVLIVILTLLARHLSQPLQELINRMQGLVEGNGDLSKRLNESGRDEMAALSRLINLLMDRLMHLIQGVQRAGIQVAGSVKQISASAKEQEASTTEYAATANQVAASIREITITSRDLGHAVTETNTLVQQADNAAGRSQARLERMDETMNFMASSSQAITTKLAILNDKAASINSMVTTINKVADQTNLLSLNAAIEAEKAGEYGRGFAVVATEIRRLADQTAVATYDIEQMVKEVQSAVAAGVMSMDKFSDDIQRSVDEARQASVEMAEVIALVQSFAPHMESINEGLSMQNEEAEEISDAMVNLSEAAQQTADLVSQTNHAIGDLDEAVDSLQDAVGVFMIKKH